MDKLDHLGWVVSSSFAIGDVRFAVRSTSPAFGEWLSRTLGAYEVEDVEEFLYSVVVPEPPVNGRAKEFCILYKGSTAIVRTLDPVTLGRGLLAELEGLRFHERDDAVYLTASIVDMSGTPTLVPSSLVPGLAKLGRRAKKLGVQIPGELTVAIDMETASVVPVRHTLDVSDDALERLHDACPWEGGDGLRFVDAPEQVRALLVPQARRPTSSRRGRGSPWRTWPAGRSTCSTPAAAAWMRSDASWSTRTPTDPRGPTRPRSWNASATS